MILHVSRAVGHTEAPAVRRGSASCLAPSEQTTRSHRDQRKAKAARCGQEWSGLQSPRATASWAALNKQGAGALTESLLNAPNHPSRGAVTVPGGGQKLRECQPFTLGFPAEEWWKPWPLLGTPGPRFTFSFQQLRSPQQLEQGQGEELEDPLRPAWILPRPPTEGGASAEVSVTQSRGDETPGTEAKRMACSLGSCRWRTPRREDRGQPLEARCQHAGDCPGHRPAGHTPHGRECLYGPISTSCFLECPGLSPLRAWTRSAACRLKVSRLGGKAKRARAPHKRGHSHNQGTHTVSLVRGKCELKSPARMAEILKTDNAKSW